MDDLISRQAAIDAINKMKIYRPLDSDRYVISDCLNKIVHLPSAQPERKRGRWILNESQRKEDVACGNYLYICSKCGKSDIHAKTQEVPFCWWCGAAMRGGENEAD